VQKEPDRLVAAPVSGSGVAPRAGFPAPAADAAGKIKTPFIVFHGDLDTTVLSSQSLMLKEILDANKVPCERHVYEGVGHPVDQGKSQEVYALMKQWFQQHGVFEASGQSLASPANSQM
jgi:predicted esterase